MIDLENKTVVIIGGSSGIGLATSSLAAKLGANLIIAGRSVEKLEIAKKIIGSDKCEIYTLDSCSRWRKGPAASAQDIFFEKSVILLSCFMSFAQSKKF